MHTKIKTKIFISLLIIFTIFTFFQFSFAKYVIENIFTVATLNIHREAPMVQLVDITTSNSNSPNYANKTHIISGHIRVNEKSIYKNDLSIHTIIVLINDKPVTVTFKYFRLTSKDSNGKSYEFAFTNTIDEGSLSIMFPKGIVESESGLVNDETKYKTNIIIDNTSPIDTFSEVLSIN